MIPDPPGADLDKGGNTGLVCENCLGGGIESIGSVYEQGLGGHPQLSTVPKN